MLLLGMEMIQTLQTHHFWSPTSRPSPSPTHGPPVAVLLILPQLPQTIVNQFICDDNCWWNLDAVFGWILGPNSLHNPLSGCPVVLLFFRDVFQNKKRFFFGRPPLFPFLKMNIGLGWWLLVQTFSFLFVERTIKIEIIFGSRRIETHCSQRKSSVTPEC